MSMNLLELLRNEKIVKLLEDIDQNLTETLEDNNDLSFIFPTIIFILELLLQKNGRSNKADVIYTMKKLQEMTEEKPLPDQKVTEFLEKTIIKQKKLNYGNI